MDSAVQDWSPQAMRDLRMKELAGAASGLNELARLVHETACSKGWWDVGYERSFGELIALIHSEASEALEAFRDGDEVQGGKITLDLDRAGGREGVAKPHGVAVELADVIIRVLDVCARYEIDISGVLAYKMFYNDTRPIRHGDKVL